MTDTPSKRRHGKTERPLGPWSQAVAKTFEDRRWALRLSKIEVARRTGGIITNESAGRILRGEIPILLDQFTALCKALELDWIEVLTAAQPSVTALEAESAARSEASRLATIAPASGDRRKHPKTRNRLTSIQDEAVAMLENGKTKGDGNERPAANT